MADFVMWVAVCAFLSSTAGYYLERLTSLDVSETVAAATGVAVAVGVAFIKAS